MANRHIKSYAEVAGGKPVRLIELFAGIGAQAKALKNLQVPFERWRVCEFDGDAINSYNVVHGTNFAPSDITKINADDLGITNTDKYTYILTYSFPCQDLSSAGKGRGMEKGSGTRSGLLWEVERLLDECSELPQVLLMENVTQVHNKKNRATFDRWLAFLESKGYSNYWDDLNSKDYGIPQSRNRCFMVSVLGAYDYTFPAPITLENTLKDILDEHVDSCYYLTADPCLPSSSNLRGTILQREVCEKAINLTEPYEVIDYSYSNSRLAEIAKGKVSVMNKGFPQVMNTLTTQAFHFGIRLPSGSFRILTPRECWRLMGFSDADFDGAALFADDKRLYQQAGNSIVVNVLMAIFRNLLFPQNQQSESVDIEDWMN